MAGEKIKLLIASGRAAMGRGEWGSALSIFQEVRNIEELPEALELLGSSAWWLNNPPVAFEALERAYQIYCDRKDARGSARTAVWLARARLEFRGEHAVANGWLQRARTHLEGLQDTPEFAWLLLFEGNRALMGKKDTAAARSIARNCVNLGKTLNEPDIEMWGRSLDGMALVIEGDIAAGMQQLDEAAAIGVGGEAKDLNAIAATCCYLIEACERAMDHERAAQWYERTKEICRKWHFGSLFAVCRAQYANILISTGRWTEADAELAAAKADLVAFKPTMGSFCDVRIGELRRRQGRFEEAAQFFSSMESHPSSLLGRGSMALDAGDPITALDLAGRFLRRIPLGDRVPRIPGLVLQLRAHVALGQFDGGGAIVGELLSLGEAIPIDPIKAAGSFAAGLYSFATDEISSALQQFEDALDLYDRAGMPYDSARARFQLALVLQELGRTERARAEVQKALDEFQRLGASRDADECYSFIKELLKDTDWLMQETLRKAGMTKREAEVLTLIATGKTNEAIAAQLFLSIRTVERHISSIYQKIGLSGRAARAGAVSFAVKAGLLKLS